MGENEKTRVSAGARWRYLIAGTVMLLFAGVLYAWSIFKVSLLESPAGWSEAQLSLTFSISMICFSLGSFVAGKLARRLDCRWIVRMSAGFLLVGFFGASFIGLDGLGLLPLYACYAVFGGFGVGLLYNAVITTVIRWFPDRSGFATGVLLMGFGSGGMLFGSMIRRIIELWGIQATFQTLAVLALVILGVGSFCIAKPKTALAAHAGTTGKTPAQMLRSGSFWVLFVWGMLVAAAGLLVINNAASIALAFGVAPVLGLLVSVTNGVGRVVTGMFFDRFGGKTTMLAHGALLVAASGILLLSLPGLRAELALCGMLCVGLCYGAVPALTSLLVKDLYGDHYYTENFGISVFASVPGAIIGPIIASVLLTESGGDYTTTFFVMACITWLVLFSAALMVRCMAAARREREKAAVA